jgi:periplasmic protein TonB
MFEQSLVLPTPDNKRWTFALSITLQVAAVCVMVLLPLIYTERLSQVLTRGPLFAPTPPPPPPPPVVSAQPRAVRVAPRMASPLVFLRDRAPRPLVNLIDKVFDDPMPASVCTHCVVGGTGSVDTSGVLGSLGSRVTTPPPPPPAPVRETKPEPPKLVRVGGDVLAAKMIRRVMPIYPALAKQARISGTVRLEGKIARDGTISELKVMSGHPLLVPAALDAVRQWIYRPTLLNGEPVEVAAPIEVNFTLSN